jgi:hypothetical protein
MLKRCCNLGAWEGPLEGLLLVLLLVLLVVVEPGEEELVEGGLRLHLQLQLLGEQLLQDCWALFQPLDL